MIHINKNDIFKEFQKNVMNMVQNEAIMCGMKEYVVGVRNHHIEVTIYVHRYSVTLVFYISGRVVVKSNDNVAGEETVIRDVIDKSYVSGRCSIVDLASEYIFELFNEAQRLRQRWRMEYKERYNERMIKFAEAIKESIKEA